MNFTQRDLIILLSMSLAVILMTFTFSALGLGNENVTTSDIPEFNASAGNFDLVGELPDSPGTPDHFKLVWNQKLGADSRSQIWLDGDTDSGTEIFLTLNSTSNGSNPDVEVQVNNWSSGTADSTHYELWEVGDYIIIDVYDYTIYAEYDDLNNVNETDETSVISFEVRDRPNDDLEQLPVIGGIISAGGNLYAVVSWIGTIIWWISATIIETSISVILSLYNIVAFLVSLMHWLIITYSGIISGANNFAAVFVAIPGILLSVEFAKLIMIGIKLLPTT